MAWLARRQRNAHRVIVSTAYAAVPRARRRAAHALLRRRAPVSMANVDPSRREPIPTMNAPMAIAMALLHARRQCCSEMAVPARLTRNACRTSAPMVSAACKVRVRRAIRATSRCALQARELARIPRFNVQGAESARMGLVPVNALENWECPVCPW